MPQIQFCRCSSSRPAMKTVTESWNGRRGPGSILIHCAEASLQDQLQSQVFVNLTTLMTLYIVITMPNDIISNIIYILDRSKQASKRDFKVSASQKAWFLRGRITVSQVKSSRGVYSLVKMLYS